MTRARTFTIAAGAFHSAPAPRQSFISPCSCRDAHGKDRWSPKNDPRFPPVDASTVQAVTPSDVFSWSGPSSAFNAAIMGKGRIIERV